MGKRGVLQSVDCRHHLAIKQQQHSLNMYMLIIELVLISWPK